MALTYDITGLKLVTSPRAYHTLTDGGLDAVAQVALDQATNIINAKFNLAGETPDFTDQIVINAGLCYAVYKLYSRIENEIIAKDKWDCGNGLLSSIIGMYAYFDPENLPDLDIKAENIQSFFIVEEGTDCWNSYGGFDE